MQHVHPRPPGSGAASAGSELEVTLVYTDATHARLRAAGVLNLSTVDLLTAVLETLLGWGRHHARLDLTGVTITDGRSLEALVRVHEMFLAVHGLLVLSPVNADLVALLRENQLERALFIAEPSEPSGTRWDGADWHHRTEIAVGSGQ